MVFFIELQLQVLISSLFHLVFWILTVLLWKLIELASPQVFPEKRSCLAFGGCRC